MAYKSVKFLAQEWREHEDPATAELIIEASFPSLRNRCLVLAEPIAGTEPPEIVYTCISVSCTGDNQCVLKQRKDSDGSIVYYCDCEPIGAVSVSARSAKKARKKAN